MRYRDIWDLRWLATRPRLSRESLSGLVSKKAEDYYVESDFRQVIAEFIPKLPGLINEKAFEGLMRRFLPSGIIEQTLERESFRYHLIETLQDLYGAL